MKLKCHLVETCLSLLKFPTVLDLKSIKGEMKHFFVSNLNMLCTLGSMKS